ncbi:bis(5'-nucleosyl)-tetraphosphatase (symmetrical) [Burkholderia ubonensis]|uniref:Bis(5'-nucleosyl)-tetraphosphatase, symmetrical n=2 Tax=Burkholderia ubonensis TaxID=101571 RepID=A0AA40RAT3_9BURK|nr:symmetrical bis(5'-nucleosyl)-tetraphosphatase [Burkholderia ubonensis]KVA71854.1 bis(5'-nucleosyl)-tetraphosphatase (symmetrical) [Burkholderia ubonensis]KVU31461.1 bis(5'-nucleosyl)-tetraphosphatase (symmetrical) [Burkholderia ubonensis]KVX28793.1 bis(5'-nucleosyl)-tetraphosphatase (symmetrical) [Burkholderia ubonensis]KWK93761.1 bis(5'-nucleosyl)-tetraphosphatase (symmetrical) [Burkholderia ubonensis]KWN05927.1 bis(5'-nucleosyl)-tetraphosphatase (symmetrical) [Burkholderia ubonensis]
MPPPPIAIGDIQGCHSSFRQLTEKLAAPPDTPFWIAGDVVNRGPASLAALRELVDLGPRATVVLGNHDLHLLAVAAGIRTERPGDTIGEILDAPDAEALLEWVRHRPFAHFEHGMLLVHAGVLPQWDVTLALELADELQRALRAPDWRDTLAHLYGNEPNQWNPNLKKRDRMRVAFNAFTRIRFCTPDGAMEFRTSGGPASAPPGYLPWFDVPGRRTEDVTVVFGHWAALGLMLRDNVIALDSGCVWGNQLSAVRLTADPAGRTVTQVQCEACRTPGE